MVFAQRQLAQSEKSYAGDGTIQDMCLSTYHQSVESGVPFATMLSGKVFGEMHQIDPVFGPTHDAATVAALVGVEPADISEEGPIQNYYYGSAFAVVP